MNIKIKNNKSILSEVTMSIAGIFWHLALPSVLLQCMVKSLILDKTWLNLGVMCSS